MTTVSAIVVYVFTIGDLERTLSTNPESQLPTPPASTPLGKTQTSNIILRKSFAGNQTMAKRKKKKRVLHVLHIILYYIPLKLNIHYFARLFISLESIRLDFLKSLSSHNALN